MNELQHTQQEHSSRTRLLVGSSLLLLDSIIMVFWALNTYPCSRTSTCESSAILTLTAVLSLILGCIGWSLFLSVLRKSSVAFRVVFVNVVLLGGLAGVVVDVIHPGLIHQILLRTLGSLVGWTIGLVIIFAIEVPFMLVCIGWPVIRSKPWLLRRFADPKN